MTDGGIVVVPKAEPPETFQAPNASAELDSDCSRVASDCRFIRSHSKSDVIVFASLISPARHIRIASSSRTVTGSSCSSGFGPRRAGRQFLARRTGAASRPARRARRTGSRGSATLAAV